MSDHYDLIVVGTGFGSSFFLTKYLELASKNKRILVLEKGQNDSQAWQLKHRQNSSIHHQQTIQNLNPDKPWFFTIGYGGGSNCWWGCTPRFLPADFEMHTRYGVSRDWPISYDELEPYYCQAESIMGVAGPSDHTPFVMSQPYPLPAHRPSSVDRALLKKYPHNYFIQPNTRASNSQANRPTCCGNGVCSFCPIGAKFSIKNHFSECYRDPRVTLALGSEVTHFDYTGNSVSSVSYNDGKQEIKANCDLLVLGANAIFNPHIMLRSGLKHTQLGGNLCEQEALLVKVDLQNIDNFDGSTSITGHNYAFYDGDHRREHAAALVESWNMIDDIRLDEGKWRKRVIFKAVFEEIPKLDNKVELNPENKLKPLINHGKPSTYTMKGMEAFRRTFPDWLSQALAIEKISIEPNYRRSEAHIIGTTVMGNDPANSIVDKNLVHHQLRNLVVVGSGVYPSCPPANPSLTISALSLRAAERIML